MENQSSVGLCGHSSLSSNFVGADWNSVACYDQNFLMRPCVPLVPAREVVGSPPTVRVIVGEHGEDIATSVGIPIPHAYTARCYVVINTLACCES